MLQLGLALGSNILHLLAFAILLGLTGDDAADQRALGLDELLHYPLHLHHHHSLHRLIHVDSFNLRLGSRLLGGFEVGEEVLGLHHHLPVCLQVVDVRLQLLQLLLPRTLSPPLALHLSL
jgi:hypothetical protein